mmetsp:Transcript_27650/g.59616  ORF Transcript_27650/g.59616 Transcript_27650/m.59616 type:complete len:123 (+) Transcript_27650:102-470(+)
MNPTPELIVVGEVAQELDHEIVESPPKSIKREDSWKYMAVDGRKQNSFLSLTKDEVTQKIDKLQADEWKICGIDGSGPAYKKFIDDCSDNDKRPHLIMRKRAASQEDAAPAVNGNGELTWVG